MRVWGAMMNRDPMFLRALHELLQRWREQGDYSAAFTLCKYLSKGGKVMNEQVQTLVSEYATAMKEARFADAVQAALALDRAIPPWSAGAGMTRWHFLSALMLRAARQGQVAEGLRAVEEMEKMLQEDADEDDK